MNSEANDEQVIEVTDPTQAEMMNTVLRQLDQAVEHVKREAAHMERHRHFLAWGALVLTAASAAALFAADNTSAVVFSAIQLALWSFIAFLNFGGPSISEWIMNRRKP